MKFLTKLKEQWGLVVNAQHIKVVPGRKTDDKDAEWIAKLLHHGLLKASFIPYRTQRELRELVQYRRSMIEERAYVIFNIIIPLKFFYRNFNGMFKLTIFYLAQAIFLVIQ